MCHLIPPAYLITLFFSVFTINIIGCVVAPATLIAAIAFLFGGFIDGDFFALPVALVVHA